MKKALFLIFVVCHTGIAFGATQPYFRCLRTALTEYSIGYGNEDETSLVDLEFQTSAFGNQLPGCVRWVLDLRRQQWYRKGRHEVRLKTLVSSDHQKVGRLIGPMRKEIYAFCQKHPTCRIKFPYNLHWAAIVGAMKQNEKPFPTLGDKCLAHTRQIGSIPKRKTPLKELEIPKFSKVEPWLSPLSTFSESLHDLISKNKKGTILVSTMNLSEKQIDLLIATLERKPNLEIYLVTSLEHLLADATNNLLKDRSENLHLFPVFPNPTFTGNYHIKGAVHLSKTMPFVFTAVNLKTHDKVKHFDLGLKGKDRQFGSSMAKLFLQEADSVCSNLKYVHCTLDLRYGGNNSTRFAIMNEIVESCRSLSEKKKKLMATFDDKNAPLLMTYRDDVIDSLVEFIGTAKKSLDISAHFITQPNVARAIYKASKQNKDLRLRLLIPNEHFLPGPYSKEMKELNSYPKGYTGPPSHSKGVLVDGHKLFIGTGNFTPSGLARAKEFFFITRDKVVVNSFKRFINTVLAQTGTSIPYPNLSKHADGMATVYLPEPYATSLKRSPANSRKQGFWNFSGQVASCLNKSGPLFFYPHKYFKNCLSKPRG